MSLSGLGEVAELGKSLLNKFVADKGARQKHEVRILELQAAGDLAELDAYVKGMVGQLEINKIEASSKSLFIAGWRPAVGWICASGLAWNFIVTPIINQFWAISDLAPPASIDIGELMTLLLAMLGMAAQRSYDKKNKIQTDSLG